jgi:hypothetical protein
VAEEQFFYVLSDHFAAHSLVGAGLASISPSACPSFDQTFEFLGNGILHGALVNKHEDLNPFLDVEIFQEEFERFDDLDEFFRSASVEVVHNQQDTIRLWPAAPLQ